MALPTFIDPPAFPDCQQVPWPVTFKMQSQWYLLPADRDVLQEVCDVWLSLDTDKVKYLNLLDYALLTVNNYTYLHPDEPPYSGRGWLTTKEIALCVMAAKFKGKDLLPSGVTLFTPLIFVDSPMAAVTGLGVYGFTKQVSQIEIPDDVENPSPTSLRTWVFPKLDPKTRLEMASVLSITANDLPSASSGFKSYQEELRYVFRQTKRSNLDPAIAEAVEILLVDAPLTLTTLKQFRDAQDPDKACYQAIVESKMKYMKDFSGDLLKGTYDVSLTPSGSLPVAESLGTGVLDQVRGIWFKVQLQFGYAENLVVKAG